MIHTIKIPHWNRKHNYQYLFRRATIEWNDKNQEIYFKEYMIHKQKCREHYYNLQRQTNLLKFFDIWDKR